LGHPPGSSVRLLPPVVISRESIHGYQMLISEDFGFEYTDNGILPVIQVDNPLFRTLFSIH